MGAVTLHAKNAGDERGASMGLFGKPKGRKLHTRTIEVNTYEYDAGRLVVEGALKDLRWQDHYLATGEKKPPGVLHGMIIHLLVNIRTLEIEDVHVEMPDTPREECLETRGSIERVKGMRIAGGFTLKVKEMLGGIQGCSHLLALLTAMAPAAVQGFAAHILRDDTGLKSTWTGLSRFLEDTCWVWRKDGPLLQKLQSL
jgi:hypothetical protein